MSPKNEPLRGGVKTVRNACSTKTLVAFFVLTLASIALAQRRGWAYGRGSEAASQPTTNATTAPADPYAIVVDRNIFLRDRRPPVVTSTRPPASRPYVAPPTLEASLVLRGVVLEEDVFHAYFENASTNEMVRVSAGDPLAKGRVADISIDAIEFETPGGATWIKIGDNLVGTQVSAPAASSTPTSTTQPGAASTTNPALTSIEERMRQRRLERSGGK